MSNKKMLINILAGTISFLCSFGINFFLSPFIVKNIGAEAYGFVSLANNFVSYISLITIALNSLSGRFISISYYNEDYNKASIYFNSVLFSNIITSLLLFLPCTIFILKIDRVITIPYNLLTDIKILFSISFISFFISLLSSVFNIAVYVKNMLYLNSFRNIETSIFRALFLLGIFIILPAKIFYIGLAALIVNIYTISWNIKYTKKLLPEMRISRKFFNVKAIFELISSGFWSLITQLGIQLMTGLDLLITNMFISTASMGTLAIAKTVPSVISAFIFMLSDLFSPDLTRFYAKNQHGELRNSINKSIKILGIFSNIPLVILLVYGSEFFRLWMPTQNAKELQVLSVITIISYVFNGSVASVFNGFNISNKLKLQAIVVLISGILNTIIVLILLKITNLGIYAVAGVSTAILIIRDIVFGLPFATKYLGFKWYTFYPKMIINILVFIINSVLGLIIKSFFVVNTWLMIIVFSIITAVFCCAINFIVLLNKNEKKILIKKVSLKFMKN